MTPQDEFDALLDEFARLDAHSTSLIQLAQLCHQRNHQIIERLQVLLMIIRGTTEPKVTIQ